MVSYFARVISLLMVFSSLPAKAVTTLDVRDGELFGAKNVDVEGILYDVTFSDGSCASLFDGCDSVDDFILQSVESSVAAAQALFDDVLVDSAMGMFDSVPSLTTGCDHAHHCRIFTPYPGATSIGASVAANFRQALYDYDMLYVFENLPPFEEPGIGSVYAVWSLSTPVPLPGALPLFFFGMTFLGIVAHRRR